MPVSEYHLYKLIHKLFEDYIVFPPSTVKSVDFLIVKEAYLIEVKNSALGLYSASKQLIERALVSKIYEIPLIAVIPFPDILEEAVAPILYFFKIMNDYNVKRKEIWILDIRRELIVHRIKLKGDELIGIKIKAKSRVFNAEMDVDSILNLLRSIKEGK